MLTMAFTMKAMRFVYSFEDDEVPLCELTVVAMKFGSDHQTKQTSGYYLPGSSNEDGNSAAGGCC